MESGIFRFIFNWNMSSWDQSIMCRWIPDFSWDINDFDYIFSDHYSDVIMSAMVSQFTGVSIVCSIVCSGADQKIYQSSASLNFVKGIHRWPADSPNKGRVTGKMFPLDDVIMDETISLKMMDAILHHVWINALIFTVQEVWWIVLYGLTPLIPIVRYHCCHFGPYGHRWQGVVHCKFTASQNDYRFVHGGVECVQSIY